MGQRRAQAADQEVGLGRHEQELGEVQPGPGPPTEMSAASWAGRPQRATKVPAGGLDLVVHRPGGLVGRATPEGDFGLR